MGVCKRHEFASAVKHCPDCASERARPTLRERCEKLLMKAAKYNPESITYEDIESFAREIRNEALDQALSALNCAETSCPVPTRAMCNNPYHQRIRALKTAALAAMANTKEVDNENV